MAEIYGAGLEMDLGSAALVFGNQVYVDSELSDTSENPVQNKVVSKHLNALATFTGEHGRVPLFTNQLPISTDTDGTVYITTSLAEAKVLVMRGAAGKAPRINAENNHWEVYDNDTQVWVDTGVTASLDDAQIANAVDEYLEEHPVSVPVDSVNGKTGAVVLGASDVGALPADTPIPATVTEQTVAGWGFTKNTGDYTKPSGGIPKADLASDVQESLGKADTALQEIADVIYDIPAEFHSETSDRYFTFASGVNASAILSALNAGKLPIVRNNYGSLKRKWFYADYNDDGTDIYIQFFRETQFSREVMLYTESTGKAYVASTSMSSFQRKPVVVWEVQDVSQGLLALNANISSSLAWQLTDLDLTPFKRIKIYVRAGRKTGSLSADSSITPASIIEMSLDDRAKETVSQNAFIGSSVVQNPNDPNRLGLITCAVSGDKTKFAVLRASTLYGTAATSNTDAYPYVFLIEGYYD